MSVRDSINLKNIVIAAILALVAWNLYTGAKLQEVGVPGLFSFKFGYTQRVTMSPLERDINIQGKDIDISSTEVADPYQCQRLCENDERCKAMTFVKHPDRDGCICWLKSSAPDRSERPGMISSVKQYSSK